MNLKLKQKLRVTAADHLSKLIATKAREETKEKNVARNASKQKSVFQIEQFRDLN